MNYEWDETKRADNLAKHAVDFAWVEDFAWDGAFIIPDKRREYGEPRFIAIGYLGERLYVLVFTPRLEATRVIGLRKANRREVKFYVAQI